MNSLIVEDDFISRRIIKELLLPFGDCDIAVNGQEADSFIVKPLSKQKLAKELQALKMVR